MRRILMAVVMAAGVLVAAPSAQAEPNPDTCEGYPEPRVFVEAQGWWVQEPGDNGDHFGHIHVGTCFPLFQTVRGTVGFDLKFQLHDNPGQLFRVSPFLCTDQTNNDCYNVPRVLFEPPLTCPTEQCVFYHHIDVDTTKFRYNGMNGLRFRTDVKEPDGNMMRAVGNWLMNVQNGGGRPTKTYKDGPAYIDGKGWFDFYSPVRVLRGYTPNPSTPFTIEFRCGSSSQPVESCMAMVDPNFHASPPSEGTVLYRSTQGRKLTIDPALYSPGPHALVLRSCTHDTLASPGKDAHRCGVLKLPFTTPSPPPARTSS